MAKETEKEEEMEKGNGTNGIFGVKGFLLLFPCYLLPFFVTFWFLIFGFGFGFLGFCMLVVVKIYWLLGM
ncbi:hypothetical protein BZA77DRAFT_310945 [Pyronema omphalodes]|nr:hypothetical protein BZA77DRAFT_310945 [Pyronema omphalodes]